MFDALFPLPIFPEGSLASSVVTTVWVGVFVITFFNLRFGWVLSGLVVPGYLVPLLIARPLSFGVIILEASVTYFIVWLFSEKLSGGRSWSSLFGRDRFVALVLASICVRLIFDGWLLPAIAVWGDARYVGVLDLQANLHSFGLVVVALMANQLWKPGYLRGMMQTLVVIGLSYIAVRFVLMEYTNFRISAVAFLYEDVASAILASPKSYIIVVITILLASRMNLRYGWDFNGVLIPALIALQWYQPIKVAASIVEAGVIYAAASLLLRLPVFANVTIEGARKTLLFFNISFVYRLILGHALFWLGYEGKITDYYGFGYLLSTLIAIKMFDKDIAVRLIRSTLQISLVGAAVGTVVGFAFVLLLVAPAPIAATADPAGVPPAIAVLDVPPGSFVTGALAGAYAARLDPKVVDFGVAATETQIFRRAVRLLLRQPLDAQTVEQGVALLRSVDFKAARLPGGVLAITDDRPGRAAGVFLIDPAAGQNLHIAVPDPLATPGLAATGAAVMRALGARTLAVTPAGSPRPAYASGAVAFREAAGAGVLVVSFATGKVPPQLTVDSRLPVGLDLSRLETRIGAVGVAFGAVMPDLQGAGGPGLGLAALALDRRALDRMLGAPDPAATDRTLSEVLAQGAATLPQTTAAPLNAADLLFFDREILVPLLTSTLPALRQGPGDAETGSGLAAIRQAAAAAGYTVLTGDQGADRFVALVPAVTDRGTFVFRVSDTAQDYVVQVPRPKNELRTLQSGSALFQGLQARALLIDGETADGQTSGPTLFDLVSQAVLRESAPAPLVVQTRGFSRKRARGARSVDAIIAFDVMPVGDRLDPRSTRLVQAVEAIGAGVAVLRGDADTGGFELGGVRQTGYLSAIEGGGFAVVWLSPTFRGVHLGAGDLPLFDALAIPTVEATPETYFATARLSQAFPPAAVIAALEAYRMRGDAVALQRAQGLGDGGLTRLLVPGSGQQFMVLTDVSGGVQAVVNLSATAEGRVLQADQNAPLAAQVATFERSGAVWFYAKVAP